MTGVPFRDEGPQRARGGWVRPGRRLYAIGDIHGHADLLQKVGAMIEADLVGAGPLEALTIFLGDYIDRGPRSADVIERLARRDFPTDIVTLRGNHEQMLLDGLDRARTLRHWLANGGFETAESYGLPPGDAAFGSEAGLKRALFGAIPTHHLAFLEDTGLSHTVDGYFFCHAGIEPGVAFEQQSPETLLWIRDPFHRSRADHGKVVVHGHTPVPEPESLPNRINIDTGAFRTGVLTCLALEGKGRRFLATKR